MDLSECNNAERIFWQLPSTVSAPFRGEKVSWTVWAYGPAQNTESELTREPPNPTIQTNNPPVLLKFSKWAPLRANLLILPLLEPYWRIPEEGLSLRTPMFFLYRKALSAVKTPALFI